MSGHGRLLGVWVQQMAQEAVGACAGEKISRRLGVLAMHTVRHCQRRVFLASSCAPVVDAAHHEGGLASFDGAHGVPGIPVRLGGTAAGPDAADGRQGESPPLASRHHLHHNHHHHYHHRSPPPPPPPPPSLRRVATTTGHLLQTPRMLFGGGKKEGGGGGGAGGMGMGNMMEQVSCMLRVCV